MPSSGFCPGVESGGSRTYSSRAVPRVGQWASAFGVDCLWPDQDVGTLILVTCGTLWWDKSIPCASVSLLTKSPGAGEGGKGRNELETRGLFF